MKAITFRNLPLGFFAIVALSGRAYPTDLDDSAHVADAHLETTILAKFNGNPRLRVFDIAVFVAGREVVLTGTVDDNISRAMAEQIAADQTGTGSVTNHLLVNDALKH